MHTLIFCHGLFLGVGVGALVVVGLVEVGGWFLRREVKRNEIELPPARVRGKRWG